jgi:hypothetical protein
VNANKSNAHFGKYQNGSISGSVVVDTNGDGDLTGDSTGIEGVTVTAGGFSDVTNSDGNFTITGVTPGTHDVCQTVPAGWAQSVPPANGCHEDVEVTSGQDVTGLAFGDFQQGSISGTRLVNGDPFPGQTVRLLDDGGTEVGTTTTDSMGDYQFTGLNPGDYTVCTGNVGDTTGTPGAPCETDEVGTGASVVSGQETGDVDFTDIVEGEVETVTCGETTQFDDGSGIVGSVSLEGCEGSKVVQFTTDPELDGQVNEVTYDTIGEGVEGGYALEHWIFPFVPAPAPGVDVFLYYDDGAGETVAPFCLDDPRGEGNTLPDGLDPNDYLPTGHTTCIIVDHRTTKPGPNEGVPDVQGDFWLFSVGDPGRGFR